MPQRRVVATELSRLFSVFSHPHRIQIVETLRQGEQDVNGLMEVLGVAHSRVSQHLALLRSAGLVDTRRDGRHIYYELIRVDVANWVREGLEYVTNDPASEQNIRDALSDAKRKWSTSQEEQTEVT